MNSNHSMQKSIFSFTGNILCTLNKKIRVGGLSRDLPRAFDCVRHDKSFIWLRASWQEFQTTVVSSYSTAEKPVKCQESLTQPQTVVDLYSQQQCCANLTFCMILSVCQYTMHTSSFCCNQVLVISYVQMHVLLYRLPSKTVYNQMLCELSGFILPSPKTDSW